MVDCGTKIDKAYMNMVAQHNKNRKPDAKSHETERLRGGSANTRTRVNVSTKTHKPAGTAATHKKSFSEQTNSTGKELRRMSRSELIEVIYALEQDNQSLQKENEKLRSELNDKDIRIATSGSIAEAALSLNHIFEDAQAAADQYLSSVKNAQNPTATPHRRYTP